MNEILVNGIPGVIHSSHKMTEWRHTIVTLIATPRFGEIRVCTKCGAEHARTVCGEDAHEELLYECNE